LPPKEEREDEKTPPSIEEPKTPEPKTPGIEDRKGGVHIQEEDEDEEDKEETVSSATPSS
jgi:hypothetical protein